MPPDDPDIPDDAVLLRRIFPGFYVEQDGVVRLSSQAFDDPRDGSSMSVWVLARLLVAGISTSHVLAGFDGHGLVALHAGQVRGLGFGITWVPDPTDGLRGHAHAEVHCRKTPGQKRRLRDVCTHVAGPLAA